MRTLPDPSALRSILQDLCDFDTALLANTIDCIDPTPAHEWYMGGSIRSVTPALGPSVGIAVTCEMDSSTPNNKLEMDAYWRQLEQISKMNLPVVWVVKAAGSRPDHECVLGDGMAKTLHSVGCVAAVTDAGVRDVSGLLTVPFAAYCRGTVIHHTPLRVQRIEEPVEVGGILIRPGDVLHANAEGVIRIPPSCLEKFPDSAVRMRTFEYEAHRLLRRSDVPLSKKRQGVVELLHRCGLRASDH